MLTFLNPLETPGGTLTVAKGSRNTLVCPCGPQKISQRPVGVSNSSTDGLESAIGAESGMLFRDGGVLDHSIRAVELLNSREEQE